MSIDIFQYRLINLNSIKLVVIFKKRRELYILMTLTISDIMRKKLETIEEMASVQEAAKKMKDKNVSSLVVVDLMVNHRV